MKDTITWHQLFVTALTDYFTNTRYRVDPEKDTYPVDRPQPGFR
jgi:hypothetical protein